MSERAEQSARRRDQEKCRGSRIPQRMRCPNSGGGQMQPDTNDAIDLTELAELVEEDAEEELVPDGSSASGELRI